MKPVLAIWLSNLLCFASFLHLGCLYAETANQAALQLHKQAFVFDAHVHLIDRQYYHGGSIAQDYADGQADLPKLARGGVDAFFLSLFTPEEYYPARYETRLTLRLVDLALQELKSHSDKLLLVRSANDFELAHREGKIAVLLDIEGSFDLDGDLALLRNLYRLGVRSVQLSAHNWTSNYADSCCSAHRWGGLNEHGEAVIREMNRLGMVINISHASEETIWDALRVSTQPLIATHQGFRHFNPIPRNISDELARQVVNRGGLICLQIGHSFHSPAYFRWRTNVAGKPFWDVSRVHERVQGMSIEEIDRLVAPRFPMVGPNPPAKLRLEVDEWLKVVDYAIELLGEDGVCIGTDFNGGPTPPKGIETAADLPLLTEAMLRRGYSPTRIQKILGENLKRVVTRILSSASH